MGTNDDAKIGMALLEEVAEKIQEFYGDVAALAPGSDYDPIFDIDNKKLQKQLDIAEKKIGNLQEGLAYLNFLRGRLMAIKQSVGGNRKMLKCAEYYQRAIELGHDEAVVRYYWGFHDKLWKERKKAIAQFEQVVNLEGVDSELGMEAAKQVEKIKADKKGICFIATAVYGSENALEVMVLRDYRDTILLASKTGRALVSLYYRLAPPVARLLERNVRLRRMVRNCIVHPLVKRCQSKLHVYQNNGKNE